MKIGDNTPQEIIDYARSEFKRLGLTEGGLGRIIHHSEPENRVLIDAVEFDEKFIIISIPFDDMNSRAILINPEPYSHKQALFAAITAAIEERVAPSIDELIAHACAEGERLGVGVVPGQAFDRAEVTIGLKKEARIGFVTLFETTIPRDHKVKAAITELIESWVPKPTHKELLECFASDGYVGMRRKFPKTFQAYADHSRGCKVKSISVVAAILETGRES